MDSEPDVTEEDEEEELQRLDGDGEEEEEEADDIVIGDPKESRQEISFVQTAMYSSQCYLRVCLTLV